MLMPGATSAAPQMPIAHMYASPRACRCRRFASRTRPVSNRSWLDEASSESSIGRSVASSVSSEALIPACHHVNLNFWEESKKCQGSCGSYATMTKSVSNLQQQQTLSIFVSSLNDSNTFDLFVFLFQRRNTVPCHGRHMHAARAITSCVLLFATARAWSPRPTPSRRARTLRVGDGDWSVDDGALPEPRELTTASGEPVSLYALGGAARSTQPEGLARRYVDAVGAGAFFFFYSPERYPAFLRGVRAVCGASADGGNAEAAAPPLDRSRVYVAGGGAERDAAAMEVGRTKPRRRTWMPR